MKALSIGIGGAPRLPPLTGALNGARAFHAWAQSLGYQTTLLDDSTVPVTIASLAREMTALLAAGPNDRLIIYFAGHGLIREMEEGLWLLSDWDAGLRAVDVEGLKRRLFQYGLKQISIISDACRSLPADVPAADLTPDRVLGRGPLAAVMPDVDKFVATQDGAATYMIQGTDPDDDRCLFSGVLMEGLWGANGAYSPVFTDKVTSRSLGKFLKTEVPKRALTYGVNIAPSVSPTFEDGEDVYFEKIHAAKAPKISAWPPVGPATALGPRWRDGLQPPSSRPPALLGGGLAPHFEPSLEQRLRDQLRPDHFETRAGFAIDGENVVALWTAPLIEAERLDRTNWWRMRSTGSVYHQPPSSPVLIEYADGKMSAVTAIQGFVGSVVTDSMGAAGLIYRSMEAQGQGTYITEYALRKMEEGAILAADVADLTIELRHGKHADLMLGVISAYLYDAINDIASIRRLAYYYCEQNQPIPYDIALLGQLSTRLGPGGLEATVPAVAASRPRTEQEEHYTWSFKATPQAHGPVAGLWPWMRQGWSYLDDPTDIESGMIISGLSDLRRHLTGARFTTLDFSGGKKLAALPWFSARRNI